MKFNAGHWNLRPDAQAIFPVTAVAVQTGPDALVVTGYDPVVNSRWGRLGQAAPWECLQGFVPEALV